ncbi:hypothetical protein JYT97_02130 [Haliea sp. AH-315-K21]|uniref:KTSC domain-containing protein n=1 Tax=SAR86 cluster bacterium TaxID=2030880 RepID=A0A2A5CDX0_9GAMM|nr:hypothetical protein [Haliea sp. AH-315-K21]PCJ42049.1 MAG: hypothetical protein COA71_05505 [SAR86 cluster bacterium]
MVKKTIGLVLLLASSSLYAVNGLDEHQYLHCGERDDQAFGSLFFLNAQTGRAFQHHLWLDPVSLGGLEALFGQEYNSFDEFYRYLTNNALNYSFNASSNNINIGYVADAEDEFNNPLKVNYQINRASGEYLWTSNDAAFIGEENVGTCQTVSSNYYRDLLFDWYNLAHEGEPEKLFEL